MEENQDHHSELELRLGQPCHEEWTMNNVSKNNPISKTQNHVPTHKHWIMNNMRNNQIAQIQTKPHGLSQPCDTCDVSPITDMPNRPQKRIAPASVVGWPPVRSCRRNLASGISTKTNSEIKKLVPNASSDEKKVPSGKKNLFVKINMDGVPIGRKVDLKAYDSYEKLSIAVDDLFRDLLASQGEIGSKKVGEKAITGLLDGSGEYVIVYEDNEGDKLLIGDVPWDMFVSTVKRIRVFKRSELSKLCVGSKQEKNFPRQDVQQSRDGI